MKEVLVCRHIYQMLLLQIKNDSIIDSISLQVNMLPKFANDHATGSFTDEFKKKN
jgi:hypothetical protein